MGKPGVKLGDRWDEGGTGCDLGVTDEERVTSFSDDF